MAKDFELVVKCFIKEELSKGNSLLQVYFNTKEAINNSMFSQETKQAMIKYLEKNIGKGE